MFARVFADDGDGSDAGADASSEPEYAFDGYTVEFSTRIMLTPPAAAGPGGPARGPGVG